LQDYQREEREQIQAFLKLVSEGRFQSADIFPPEKRFKNLHFPITYRGSAEIPIWPLVAFSGSAIIPIMPIEKEQFESFHKFKISDIEQMVSFAEDTGKLQFLLMRQPTDYYKLDFLEPIFKRLKPPQFMGIPIYEYAKHDVLSQYYKEFTAIANSGFRDYVRRVSNVGHNKRAFDSLMTNLQGNYMMLRAISNIEFSEEFAQLFRSDFENAGKLLEIIDILVLRPLRNPLKCMDAYPLEMIRIGQSLGLDNAFKSNMRFPCELGRLLMQKITCYPESLEACKQITARYDDQDVIKLLQAVNEGVIKNNPEIVEKTEKELSAALDNIWNDKSLLRRINGIRFGVPLILGAIGTVAGGLSGGYAGLLSGLGFDAADKLFEYRGDAFSEKISKFLTPSYQAIIFDFQKRYPLDSK
jgi:hypothetical protein